MSIAITQNYSAASLGVGSLDVTTAAGASTALAAINSAITLVNTQHGRRGFVLAVR